MKNSSMRGLKLMMRSDCIFQTKIVNQQIGSELALKDANFELAKGLVDELEEIIKLL